MSFKDPEKRRACERKSYRKHRDAKLARNKKWHDENVDKHKALVNNWCRSRYRRNKEITNSFKAVPCMDCGNKFPPECMDFDHRDPAEKSFTIANKTTLNLETLLAEIRKCDVVCANCHRIRTHKKKQYAKQS